MLRYVLPLAILLGACATPVSSTKDSQGPPDCISAEVQKTLTYCVSPAAARIARDNDEVRSLISKQITNPKVFPLPLQDSPAVGPESAAVTFVAFVDFTNPDSVASTRQLLGLVTSFPKDVRLVFKFTPATSKGLPVSIAALAMHKQGKFPEFVRRVTSSETVHVAKLLQELGGDPKRFEQDITSPKLQERVGQDVSLARALGIVNVPTVFLNGMPLPSDVPSEEFAPVITQQRTIVRAFLDAGVPPDEIYWRMVRAQYQPVSQEAPEPEEDRPRVVYVPTLDSPTRGAKVQDALVTITVFSDFECPFCLKANPVLEKALALAPGKVRVVFKHFPLPFHKRADNAAGLAILAHSRGKFWEAHDLLFAHQSALSDADLQGYADQLGLGIKGANAAMRAPSVVSVIERDMTMGIQLGINATPTMFINGVMLLGAPEEAEMAALIKTQLKHAEAIRTRTGKSGELLHRAIVESNRTPR